MSFVLLKLNILLSQNIKLLLTIINKPILIVYQAMICVCHNVKFTFQLVNIL